MGEGNFSLPMSSDEVIGPAMLINNYGKGKVVYLPCSPDAALASEYRTVEPRLLLRNLIRYLRPNPEIDMRLLRMLKVWLLTILATWYGEYI